MRENIKKYFLSFADRRMSSALERIKNQALAMNFFDEVYVWSEANLDEDFCQKRQDVLNYSTRGFGYWCWKSHVILKVLETMPEGGILLYCDAGCHLNPKGRSRLNDYVEAVLNDTVGVKAFCASLKVADVKEKRWTKGDVFDYFNCRNRKDITESLQIAATHVLVRKCAQSMSMLYAWNDAINNRFSLIDDTQSKSPNFPEFIENRHDQSIFSVLYKLNGCTPLPSGETENSDCKEREKYPIWDLRDRGYKDMRFWARVKRLLKAYRMKYKIKWSVFKEKYLCRKDT